MSRPLILPLDAESVRKLLGNITSLMQGAPSIEEIGDNYVVAKVPRFFGLGNRRIRLNLKIYDVGEVVLIVMRKDSDSIVIAIDVVDTGEGTHLVVSGGGSGRAAKIVNEIIETIRNNINSKVYSAYPRPDIDHRDNEIAAKDSLPPSAALVYYDSAIPVRNVPIEAGLRVLAILGSGSYLVEITDYRGTYLARIVLRENRITGAYARVDGKVAIGLEALELAKRPPDYRVKIRAWSLEEGKEAFIFEPLVLASRDGRTIYWTVQSKSIGRSSLVPNMYIVVDNYEAAVINPIGGEEQINIIRGAVGDPDQIRYIILTDAQADIGKMLDKVAALAPQASIVLPGYWAAQLSSISSDDITARMEFLPLREKDLRIGDRVIRIIPSRVCGVPTVSIYEPVNKALITGPAFGAVTPPGMWSTEVNDILSYVDMAVAYTRHALCASEFRSWLRRVTSLDIDVLAPRYGPPVKGRHNIEKLLELVSEELR